MKVLNIKSAKIKTHKWKKYDTYKECIKCYIRIHHMGAGVWVEDLQQGTTDYMDLIMKDISFITGEKFKPDVEIIDISDTCEEHIIKNIIE